RDPLRAGRESPPDLTAVQAIIAKGKSEFVNFKFKEAEKTFKTARGRLISMQMSLRDYQPLIDSLLYLAVASMNTRQPKIADQMFAELARLRPDYRIDSSQFPPVVIKAFERMQQAAARIPRGRIAVASTPPGGQVFVDEVPKGTAPQGNIPVSAGDHIIRVDLPGYITWTERV